LKFGEAAEAAALVPTAMKVAVMKVFGQVELVVLQLY
jgi:hypothetical protein